MILRNMSYEEFAEYVCRGKREIIAYGAGMIGETLAPYIFNKYGVDKQVICYVDADKRKHGNVIELASRKVFVKDISELNKISKDVIILITNSNFEPIVEYLDRLAELDRTETFILPIMQLEYSKNLKSSVLVKTSDEPLIPKVINYCWFSGNPIPDELKKCIESWRKFCPDYEIVQWDESNYDVSKCKYTKAAYEKQKWGFVPDIARLEILYKYGGFYLDTDVELKRSLDELRYQTAFCGVEKWGTINFGGCSGARPKNSVIKAILDARKNVPFLLEDGTMNTTTCGYYETTPMVQRGMELNNTTQVIDGVTVYSSEFFHPFDYMSGEMNVTQNTFSIHYFSGSWLSKDAMKHRERTQKRYKETLERMKNSEREVEGSINE